MDNSSENKLIIINTKELTKGLTEFYKKIEETYNKLKQIEGKNSENLIQDTIAVMKGELTLKEIESFYDNNFMIYNI